MIGGATLSVSSDANLGTDPAAATVGQLVLNNGTLLATSTFTLNSSHGITLGINGGTFNISSGSTLSYGGIIANGPAAASLTKVGAGALNLSGGSTYTGGTIINAGKINLTGTLSGPTVINSGGTLSATGFELGLGSSITINAGGIFNTANAASGQTQPPGRTTNFILNGGSMTGTYGVIFNAGYGITSLPGSTTSTISGSLYGYGTVPLYFNVSAGTTTSGIDLLVSGTIASYNGTTSLIKNGLGTMEITGTGAPAFNGAFYNGGAFVNAGTLIVASANTAFNTSVVPNGIYVSSGATLAFTGSDLTNVSNTINLSGGALFTLANASNPAYNGNSYYIGSVNLNSSNGLAAVASSADGSYLRFGYGANGAISSVGPVANTDSQGIILVNGSSHVMTVTTGAGNTLTLSGVITDLPTLLGTPINFNGSGTTILTGANTYTGPTTINGGTLVIGVHGALPANNSVLINSGATLVADSQATISSTSLLNVNGNVIVHNGSLQTLSTAAQNAFANNWNSTSGLISTAAANDVNHLTALGVIQNSLDQTTTGTTLYPSFEGQTVTNTDVLVKYTYYGDANLDGKVDGSDYSLIDNSYEMEGWTSTGPTTTISGWYNGDFNYDNVVDGSDYTLIDNAFNSQGTQISAEIASPTAEVAPDGGTGGGISAVPEPTSLGLLGLGAIGLLGRRRRRI